MLEAELEETTTTTFESDQEDRQRFRELARERVETLYKDMPVDAVAVQPTSPEKDDWYIGSTFNVEESEATKDTPFVPTWMRVQQRAETRRVAPEMEEVEVAEGVLTVDEVVGMLEKERGRGMTVLDVSGKCDWTETMIVVEGRSKKQLFALVDGAKKFSATDPTVPGSLVIEGANCEDWMVLDLGRIVVHAMTPEARAHYDIEGLWTSLPESSRQEEAVMGGEEEEERRMLEVVERAWAGRPVSVVKTKQVEMEDLMDEGEMIARMRGGEVVGRRRTGKVVEQK
ncbi:hypothetical protein HDU67_008627 [Dinochytrium kinnereticum]|nr:hypothetical protein HDU67_008627 [Dinochytrium kinnereticum]